MNCPKCGKENSETAKFCIQCGYSLSSTARTVSNNIKTKSRSALAQVGLWILVYGVLNLLLWGGQELYYRGDTKKMNALETEMALEKMQIDQLEQSLTTASTTIDAKEALLNSQKAAGQIVLYNSGVDGYNSMLETYKADTNKYDAHLSAYNVKVDEYNKLVEHSGSRWWLIPIPMPGNHSVPKI